MSVLLATVRLEDEDRAALERIIPEGTRTLLFPSPDLPPEDVLGDVEVLLCVGLRHFTPSMLDALTSLRFVQSLPAGADHLPRNLFREGVTICSGAGAGSHHIAEHAFALLLASAKNIVSHTQAIRTGIWDRTPINRTLRGKHLGILGFGHVGRLVAAMGRAAGMRILALNRSGTTEEKVDFAGTQEDLTKVLRQADYVVSALPLTEQTVGLLGPKELETMKPDAVLVNVGRGKVVQEEALFDHLKAHPDFRAAFDVWWTYPGASGGRPFTLPLHDLENFLMTPHVAGHGPNHRQAMMRLALENVGNFYKGKPLMNRLTPEDLPPEGM